MGAGKVEWATRARQARRRSRRRRLVSVPPDCRHDPRTFPPLDGRSPRWGALSLMGRGLPTVPSWRNPLCRETFGRAGGGVGRPAPNTGGLHTRAEHGHRVMKTRSPCRLIAGPIRGPSRHRMGVPTSGPVGYPVPAPLAPTAGAPVFTGVCGEFRWHLGGAGASRRLPPVAFSGGSLRSTPATRHGQEILPHTHRPPAMRASECLMSSVHVLLANGAIGARRASRVVLAR